MKISLQKAMLLTLLGTAFANMKSQDPTVLEKCHGLPPKLQDGAIHILHVEALSSKQTDGTYADDGYGQGEFDRVRLLDVLANPIQWKPGLVFRVHPFPGKKDEQVNFAPEHMAAGRRYYVVYTYYLEGEPHGDSDLIGLTRCGVQEDTPATRKRLLEFVGR